MKEKLLKYIESEVKRLEKIQYERSQAQALIVEGKLDSLKNIKTKIEEFSE